MRKSRFVLILLVLLGFCVPLVVPAEDVRETAYDESEALPYERTPLYSTVVRQASPRIAVELSRGSVIPFNSLAKCYKTCPENNTRLHGIPDSLSILDRSLRC